MELIETEIQALKMLKHPNIMQIFEHFQSQKNIYLVLKLYRDGDMLDYIQKKGFLSDQEVLRILPQVVSALKFAAEKTIMHRDIKLENLFMDNGNVVIGDFGLAKFLSEEITYTVLGTKPFMAPEFQFLNGYSYGADVWALGINMYMAIFGKDPWGNSEYRKDSRSGKFRLFPTIRPTAMKIENCGQNLQFPPTPTISNRLKAVLQRMIEYEPQKRINWDQLSELLSNEQILISPQPPKFTYLSNSSSTTNQNNYEQKEIESEIVERHTIYSSAYPILVSRLKQACGSLAEKQQSALLPQSQMFGILTSDIPNRGRGINTTSQQDLNSSVDSAEQEFIDQYINYNICVCEFFLATCMTLNDLAENRVAFTNLKGVISLLSNFVSKKVMQIADYFLKKLSEASAQFTEIQMGFDFYQNGFAKQYLQRFEEIVFSATCICSATYELARNCLPTSYDNGAKLVQTASHALTFSEEEEKGFNFGIFYMFVGLDKFSPTFQKPDQQIGKYIVTVLSTIGKYKDKLIFKASGDQYSSLELDLSELQDPNKIDSKYQKDKEYFRKWKDSLKTN
jgi:serine/threonine protein kinase